MVKREVIEKALQSATSEQEPSTLLRTFLLASAVGGTGAGAGCDRGQLCDPGQHTVHSPSTGRQSSRQLLMFPTFENGPSGDVAFHTTLFAPIGQKQHPPVAAAST